MIDIEEIARLLTFESCLPIYNKVEGKFIIKEEKIDLSNDENLIPLFSFSSDSLEFDINEFIKSNKDKYPDLKFKSIKDFNKELNTNVDLYKSWIKFFINSISFKVNSWVKLNNLEEVEASQDIYDEIRKEFDIYISHRYEEIIPDNVLIGLYDFTSACCFSVMGNSKITYGLSFYFGSFDEEYFRLMQSMEMDMTNPFLEEIVSLYFEKDVDNKPFSYLDQFNPYSKDGRISSLHLFRSGVETCYLTTSLGLLMIDNLKLINLRLGDLINSKEFKSINLDYPSIINYYGYENSYKVITFKDIDVFPDRFYYDIEGEVNLVKPLIKIKNNKASDITFRRLNTQFEVSLDERTGKISYIFLVCDHDDGMVKHSILIEGCNNPFVKLCEKINEIKDFSIGSKIYVNNILDHELVYSLLKSRIKSRRVIVNDIATELKTDIAIEALDEMMRSKGKDDNRFN